MRTSNHAIAVVIAVVAAGATLGAGCGDGASGQDDEPLVVGSDIPYAPFEFGQPPDYTGFDMDLVHEISARIDREVQIEDTSYDTIFRDLAQGKFDMIASASTITPEREQTVDFSNPYYLSAQAIVVEKGSDIASVEDFAGKTIAAQQGTTGQDYVENETDAGEVRPFPETPDAVNALTAGTVDAVVIDLPVAQDAVEKTSGIEITTTIPTDEAYGLVFQQEDDELREKVNAALQDIKDDGTYTQLYQRWFKQAPSAEVLTVTHEPT